MFVTGLSSSNSVTVESVADKVAPEVEGGLISGEFLEYAWDVAVPPGGRYVFVAGENWNAVSVVDVSDPVLVGTAVDQT